MSLRISDASAGSAGGGGGAIGDLSISPSFIADLNDERYIDVSEDRILTQADYPELFALVGLVPSNDLAAGTASTNTNQIAPSNNSSTPLMVDVGNNVMLAFTDTNKLFVSTNGTAGPFVEETAYETQISSVAAFSNQIKHMPVTDGAGTVMIRNSSDGVFWNTTPYDFTNWRTFANGHSTYGWPPGNDRVKGLWYKNGAWFALAYYSPSFGDHYGTRLYRSTDPSTGLFTVVLTDTQRPHNDAIVGDRHALAFANGKFCVFIWKRYGNGSTLYSYVYPYYSTDGISWTYNSSLRSRLSKSHENSNNNVMGVHQCYEYNGTIEVFVRNYWSSSSGASFLHRFNDFSDTTTTEVDMETGGYEYREGPHSIYKGDPRIEFFNSLLGLDDIAVINPSYQQLYVHRYGIIEPIIITYQLDRADGVTGGSDLFPPTGPSVIGDNTDVRLDNLFNSTADQTLHAGFIAQYEYDAATKFLLPQTPHDNANLKYYMRGK